MWLHYDTQFGFIFVVFLNLQNNLPLFTSVNDFDCITELNICYSNEENYWPQIHDYKQLFYENSEALFILNTRDKTKILNSYKNWFYKNESLYDRFIKFNPELISETSDQAFFDFIDNHYQKIRNFFLLQNNANFVEFDIEKDRLSKLNQYIDLSDFKKLPNKNSRKELARLKFKNLIKSKIKKLLKKTLKLLNIRK